MTIDIRRVLIRAGVKNLKEFGYPGCNEKNILTDQIYKAFFLSMLKDRENRGQREDVDKVMDELIKEIGK